MARVTINRLTQLSVDREKGKEKEKTDGEKKRKLRVQTFEQDAMRTYTRVCEEGDGEREV